MRIRELATGLQFPEGPIAMDDGSVLLVEIARGTLTRVRADGLVQVVADLGGGPNGAAIGPDGAVYVCNNGGFRWHTEADGCLRPVGPADDYSGGRIERVNLATGRAERLYDTVEGGALCGPNDIVFDAHGGFYFTDLGKTRERDMDRGGLFYGHAGGDAAHAIARPVITPNGIALSPDGQTLYYAETEGARLWAFDITAPGRVRKDGWPSPHGGRMLCASPGGTTSASIRWRSTPWATCAWPRCCTAASASCRPTAAASSMCRCPTATPPTSASAGATGARPTSRCRAAAGSSPSTTGPPPGWL
jgi:gluconolactonase